MSSLFLDRNIKDVEKNIRIQIKDIRKSKYYNPNNDPRKNFHLDNTKLAFHNARVEAWKSGKHVAPITIDMALTQRCSYACTFCYAGLQQNPAAPVDWSTYEQFLDDCVEIGHKKGEGVRAISLVSDGESTESPHYIPFIVKAKNNGIDIASGTNGYRLRKKDIPTLVDNLTYLRFNFDAADPDAYSEIMGATSKKYERVVSNIKDCVKLKRERKSDITIGLQMVLMPEYADQVIPLALLGKELGVDYTVIKHCSDDEDGRLGVDYSWYVSDLATELLQTAEAISNENYSVQAKWSKIRTGRDRKYSKCFGTPLMLQMSGTGIVAPCGSFFHKRYSQQHIGDIKEERFFDIWNSQKYKEVMSYLASDAFDAKTQCASLCLQDKVNEKLNDLMENNIPLDDVSDIQEPPHVNFI